MLPFAAALWGFASVSARSESRRIDERLQETLRVALAGYQERADGAEAAAERLARNRAFQIDLQRRDRAAIVVLLQSRPELSVTAGSFRVGHVPALAVRRAADVITRHGLAGTVVAAVPLDRSFVSALRARSGIGGGDALVLVDGSRIAAAAPTLAGDVSLAPGQVATIRVAGVRYRTLVAPALAGLPGVRLAVLSPQSRIDAANSAARDKLLLGLLGAAALVSLVAYLEGRSIVRTLRGLAEAARAIAHGEPTERVPVRGRDEFATLGTAFNEMADQLELRLAELEAERGRLRGAITRFGEALAATHDVEQLLRVIVEAAVEATGATGATLRTEEAAVDCGDPSVPGETLELPLAAGRHVFGTLFLTGAGFDVEQRMTAASLASHAAVALENARLHRIVARQANVDGLTGIANQRHCEEALAHEVSRANRYNTPLTLVLADLDDFKAINDRHGHTVGDDVLREFASVLRTAVRGSDLPGRWGGEEFVLLLPGTDGPGGVQFAERVRAMLAERSFLGRNGTVLGVTCSFGVAQHEHGLSERELFAKADRALYEAKRRGKNRVEADAAVRSF